MFLPKQTNEGGSQLWLPIRVIWRTLKNLNAQGQPQITYIRIGYQCFKTPQWVVSGC